MKKILILLFSLATGLNSFSQVKIGDNPNTINANSMLELESTNKGFLPPRVALTSVNSVTPLTATTPTGMIVYSMGGTITDGYYYWNGTKWLGLSTSNTARTNYVLVKSASDFPTSVSGVITLSANTLYEINGTITLTDKINLNGCTVMGKDHVNDKLLYTPSTGELFTGSNGGTLKMLTLSATGVGSKLFNLDAGNTNKSLIMQNILVVSCDEVGLIKGFAQDVFFMNIMFVNNAHGVTFHDLAELTLMNMFWYDSNSNTYEKYVGTFEHIMRTGGDEHTSLANSSTAIDVSGITSITKGVLKQVLFLGDGTYVNGTFSNVWEVECHGLNAEKDDVAGGNLYITTNATSNIITIDVPIKVAGTTVSASLFRCTMPTNNKLTYTGTKTRRFHIICSVTATAISSNKNFSFHIYKNGVKLSESTQSMKLASGVSAGSLTLSCTAPMSTNDYVEVWVENNTDNTDIIVTNMNLSIK